MFCSEKYIQLSGLTKPPGGGKKSLKFHVYFSEGNNHAEKNLFRTVIYLSTLGITEASRSL
jgi:hypothetical protein